MPRNAAFEPGARSTPPSVIPLSVSSPSSSSQKGCFSFDACEGDIAGNLPTRDDSIIDEQGEEALAEEPLQDVSDAGGYPPGNEQDVCGLQRSRSTSSRLASRDGTPRVAVLDPVFQGTPSNANRLPLSSRSSSSQKG